MKKGYFISFEGGEGAGKSTQVEALAAWLCASGYEVVKTREPGGTVGAEALRSLLVQGAADRWSPLSELLLLSAARADHLERVIRPALDRGAIVICDRFLDSTRAYQGLGGQIPPETLLTLETIVVGQTRPDLTFFLDVPPQDGLSRAYGRGGDEHRFESKGLEFHTRLRDAFLNLAATEPNRIKRLDGLLPIDTLSKDIRSWVERKLLSAPDPRP